VIERCRDELGDWRVCVLTPFGKRIHFPWAMASDARMRAAGGLRWRRCGATMALCALSRYNDEPPDADWFLVESCRGDGAWCSRTLGSTALFAGRFRVRAGGTSAAACPAQARAMRVSPLWQLRKRSYESADAWLRAIQSFRCCLRPIASACAMSSICAALIETLRAIEQRQLARLWWRRASHRHVCRIAAVQLRCRTFFIRRCSAGRAASQR